MLIRLNYTPRPWFREYHACGKRFAVIVASRRAGKTYAVLEQLLKDVLLCTLPNPRGVFIGPTYAQAKDIAWVYLKDFVRGLPGTKIYEGELKVELPNGGMIKLYGAESVDRLRGTYIDACVLDEFPLMPASIWTDVIRPAISDRLGKVTFIGTVNGKDAFYDIYEYAKKSELWYSAIFPASKIKHLPSFELEEAERMMGEGAYAREYECDFFAMSEGSYYGKLISTLETLGQVTRVPYDKATHVYAAWDLGIGDSTAIWTFQMVGREWHFLKAYENQGQGLDHYVSWIENQKYEIHEHLLPHDAEARELQSGKSRIEYLESKGLTCRIVKKHAVDDGIQAVRMMLNRCWFDEDGTKPGLNALRMYKAEMNSKLRTLKDKPLHDGNSHFADAFRYAVMGVDEKRASRRMDYRAPDDRNYKFGGLQEGWML